MIVCSAESITALS